MNVLSVEWIKTKSTLIRWFVFLTPFILAATIISYLLLRGSMENTQLFVFKMTFEMWTALLIPIGVGILSGYSIFQEELAGSFNGLLGSRISRRKIYLGKLLSLVWMTSITLIVTVLILGIGLSLIFNVHITWFVWIVSIIMSIIGTLPLIALHLWISFAWGMGASIGIGGGGVLIGALMATSIGDGIWQFVPWGWAVRLSIFPGAYLMYSKDMMMPPESISTGFVFSQIISGLIPAITVFMVALVGGMTWFNKWEGRKGSE